MFVKPTLTCYRSDGILTTMKRNCLPLSLHTESPPDNGLLKFKKLFSNNNLIVTTVYATMPQILLEYMRLYALDDCLWAEIAH